MMQRRRSACIVVVGTTLGLFSFVLFYSPRTAGQQQSFPQPNRKPACSCFCGDGTFKSFNLFSREDAKAGKCYGGPLPAEACGRLGGEMPAEQRRAICEGLNTSRSSSCPAVKAFCDERGDPPKPGCQKPAPWFDPQADCKDVQPPAVAINNRGVTVSVCGYPVFRGMPANRSDPVFLDAYHLVVKEHIQSTVGSKVCCDTLREAAKSGSPCDPAVDIDCDGTPNDRDSYQDGTALLPDINLFTKAKNANINRFPPGLNPDDPNFMPGPTARESKGVGDCPCKWELSKGELTCSPDGRKRHVYAATWRCPANGKEVLTTKYANASEPCEAYKGTAMLEYFVPRPANFFEFLPSEVSCKLEL